jgi:hypothetical protein
MDKLSCEEFDNLVLPLIGLPISSPWRGYGSAIFLELGKLRPPANPRFKHLKGEACLSIDWDWRIETDEKIIFGSSNSRPKIDKGLSLLTNLKLSQIKLIGKPSEILIVLSNGLRLQSMVMVTGDPQWSIKLLDGTWLSHENGSLVRMNGDEGSGGLTPEEIEIDDLADKASNRWGTPFLEPIIGNCSRCKYFVMIDGDFALSDYGVCISSDSSFDSRVVSNSSGCPKFISKKV